jgi:hypothetical protein
MGTSPWIMLSQLAYQSWRLILKGQCHEMFLFIEGLNILISTFCVAAGFKVFQKLFTNLYMY